MQVTKCSNLLTLITESLKKSKFNINFSQRDKKSDREDGLLL